MSHRGVIRLLSVVVACGLLLGSFAAVAPAKSMSPKAKAKVRTELRKQVRKNPRVIQRKSFLKKASLVLAGATVGVAIESELLVHAATEATKTLGLSETFLGLIIVPLIGNAAEHATAIVVARKGKMDLALQIALGSSTQVALLVAPILVFAGVLLGRDMNLAFTPFEILALGMATGVTAIITLDGESNWFEGVQLLALYGMLAVAAFFLV